MQAFMQLVKVTGAGDSASVQRLITPLYCDLGGHASLVLQLEQLDRMYADIRRELEIKGSLEKCFECVVKEHP